MSTKVAHILKMLRVSTSPGAVKMHKALLSHPPRYGSVHGSITEQLIPSPDQPELQVHMRSPGPS